MYTVSNKESRLISMASDECSKSDGVHKLGAIIYQGNKKICSGYNTNLRTTYRRNVCCSLHAEMDTINRFLNSYIKVHTINSPKKIRRKMSKYSICVVKRIYDCNNQYGNSQPCIDCISKMQVLGFNKVIYYADNSMKVNKISNIQNSLCTKSMNKPDILNIVKSRPLVRTLKTK